MEEPRLILPPRPRLPGKYLALFAICLLAVIGVWALQINMTLARFHDGGNDTDFQNTLDGLADANINSNVETEAALQRAQVAEGLKAIIEQEQAKRAALEKVKDSMKAELAEPAATDAPPESTATPPPAEATAPAPTAEPVTPPASNPDPTTPATLPVAN